MKTCFLNASFLNQFKSYLALTAVGLFLFTSCKCKRGCEGLDSKTEQLISEDIKNSILIFPTGKKWVFERVTSGLRDTTVRDTIVLAEQQIFPLEKGECALMDKGKCCSDYYYEKSNRNLSVISTSGLKNFTNYYTDADGLSVKGDWGSILVQNHMYSQDFLLQFKESLNLKIQDTMITDIKTAGKYLNDSTPFLVSWSKQHGLIRYAYKSGTDTIKYERVDIP